MEAFSDTGAAMVSAALLLLPVVARLLAWWRPPKSEKLLGEVKSLSAQQVELLEELRDANIEHRVEWAQYKERSEAHYKITEEGVREARQWFPKLLTRESTR